MGAKFTCDWCGEEIEGYYDTYEGWGGAETIEWWEEGERRREGYHINTFCAREYDREKGQWSKDNCCTQFFQKMNIVLEQSEGGAHYWHYTQKKDTTKELVYDKRGFYTQV